MWRASSITHDPPSSAARSRIAVMPTPAGVPVGLPTPSSSISTTRVLSASDRRMEQFVRVGMLDDIRQRLQRDTIHRHLDGG